MKKPAHKSPAPFQNIPPIGFRIWRYASDGGMPYPHAHTDLEINFLEHGSIDYLHGGKTIAIGEGNWALFWAGIPHWVISSDERVEGVWLTFPLDWLLTSNPPGQIKERLLSGEMLVSGLKDRPLDQHLFPNWLEDYNSGEPNRLKQAQFELEARIRRLGLALPPQQTEIPPIRSSGARFSVELAAGYLTRNYHKTLTVECVAETLRLHPKYLLQSFKAATGLTLWDYLIRLRLAHAQRLLLTTDMNILDIALESGFESASNFYRHFREKSGESPATFRKTRRPDQ